MPGLNT